MYEVSVKVAGTGERTTHSTHNSYVEARDQADMAGGVVLSDGCEINETGESFNTGYAAGGAGEDRTACPYAAGTWDAANWLAGWDAG